MSTPRLAALVGLALGAIWAFSDFESAVLAGLLAAVGCVIALVVQGRIDLTQLIGRQHDREPASQPITQPRRTDLQ